MKRSFDFNRGTKTTEGRALNARRKLKILKEKEKLAFAPEKTHALGTVPQFYPMAKINGMLNDVRSHPSSKNMDAFDAERLLATLDEK